MTESKTFLCPICDGPMFGVHCKLICKNCGYKEDCSDLFPESPELRDASDARSPDASGNGHSTRGGE